MQFISDNNKATNHLKVCFTLHLTQTFILKRVKDCEWKTQAGNVCVASFDWSCSGICKSIERMKEVHNACGEGDDAVWNVDL